MSSGGHTGEGLTSLTILRYLLISIFFASGFPQIISLLQSICSDIMQDAWITGRGSLSFTSEQLSCDNISVDQNDIENSVTPLRLDMRTVSKIKIRMHGKAVSAQRNLDEQRQEFDSATARIDVQEAAVPPPPLHR